jgi:hypothetical protein
MYLADHFIFAGYAMVVLALSAAVVWRFIAARKQAAVPERKAEDEL